MPNPSNLVNVPTLAMLASYNAATATFIGTAFVSQRGYEQAFIYDATATDTPNGVTCIRPSDAPGTGRWLASNNFGAAPSGPVIVTGIDLYADATVALGNSYIALDGNYPDGAGGFIGTNYLAICVSTTPEVWAGRAPANAEEVVVGEQGQKYVWTGSQWSMRPIYNYLPWQVAIANVKYAANFSAIYACVGDSETAGGYSNGTPSGLWNYAYPPRMANILNDVWKIPAGAQSFFGDQNYTANFPTLNFATYDTRVALGSGWDFTSAAGNSIGAAFLFNNSTTNAIAFTPVVTSQLPSFTSVDVFFIGGPGNGIFTFDLSGGGTRTIDTSMYSSGCHTETLTLSSGNYTANITRVSGNVNIIGCLCYDTSVSQLRVVNLGWSGGTAGDFNSSTHTWSPLPALQALNPKMVQLGFGANEMLQGIAVATYIANLQVIITSVGAYADIVLRFPPQIDTSRVPAAIQNQYRNAAKKLALTNGLMIRDLSTEFLSYAQANAAGLMFGDPVHPNGLGYLYDARTGANMTMMASPILPVS